MKILMPIIFILLMIWALAACSEPRPANPNHVQPLEDTRIEPMEDGHPKFCVVCFGPHLDLADGILKMEPRIGFGFEF